MTTDRAPSLTIGTRYPQDVHEAVLQDADRLDLTLTEYMRMAVDMTMKAKVTKRQAEQYRRPPTRAEMREQARLAREAAASNGASA